MSVLLQLLQSTISEKDFTEFVIPEGVSRAMAQQVSQSVSSVCPSHILSINR